MSSMSLPATSRRAFERMAADLRRVLDDRFIALVAYGANASAAFAASVGPGDLDALGPLVGVWYHDGLATPLLITPDEFRRSLDTFPFEYQAMLDRHVVIAGDPPFVHASIRPDDLRRACEAQARGHLIHLRQGWLEAEGHEHALMDLLLRSASPFRALLSNVARLHGAPHGTVEDIAAFAERMAGLSAGLVKAVLDLDHHPEQARTMLGRFGEYLRATEHLWDFVDAWRAR